MNYMVMWLDKNGKEFYQPFGISGDKAKDFIEMLKRCGRVYKLLKYDIVESFD